MDPVTHGFIGATASQSFADKRGFRAAAFTGLASAMLADLDVFLGSSSDPLLNLELHRHFTHSLVFIPVGALVATLLLWWFVRKYLTLKETYLFSLAGYATAGLTDYFTSYGVLLLWPFSDTRYSLDIISVFDPLFTLGVIILAGMAFYKRKQLYAWLTMGWIILYLLFGFTQQRKAVEVAQQIASGNNHEVHQLITKPTIANNWLWSIRYTTNDSLHTAGVKLLPFTEPEIFPGDQTVLLNWQEEYESFKGTTLYNDITRFSELSEGVLIRHPNQEQVIGDGRYSMLPTTLSPLWGIEVDTTQPDQHVQFGTYRDTSEEVREAFLDMLFY